MKGEERKKEKLTIREYITHKKKQPNTNPKNLLFIGGSSEEQFLLGEEKTNEPEEIGLRGNSRQR